MADNKETREVEILLNAQQANASIKDMAAGVALMNNQLAKMSQDDPRRAQLTRDFQVLTQRVGAARAEMRTYVQTEEEVRLATQKLNEENTQVILNGQKINASFNDMREASARLEKQLHEMNSDDAGRQKLLADYHALQGRIGSVSTELKNATESTNFLKQGFANAFGLLAGGGVIGVVQQLFGFFSASREEALASAKVTADLTATLKSTAQAAGLTANEIAKIGVERAKITLFDDDDTNKASAMLLTFTNIKKGVFEDAIPAIQDIATKMAGDGPADLKGASIQVGKALNDPVKGITALTRVGVTFTEQQKEQITQMVKAGNTAGAQKLILAELNKEFGGSAEAARQAAGGVATLSMGWNEFKETVGGKVNGVLDGLSQWLGRVLDKAQPLVDMVTEMVDQFTAYYQELADVVEGMGLFNEKTDTAQLVVTALKYALTVLLIPLKVGLEISRAVVDTFIDWYNKSELLRGVLGGLGAVVVSLFTTIKDDALKILGGVGDILIGIFTLDKAKIVAGFKSALAATADVALEGGQRAAEQFAKGYLANKDNHITKKVRVDTEETTTSTGSPGTPATAAPGGESEKDREKREKKEKAARDKADQEHLNDLKKRVKEEGDLLDSRDTLAEQREKSTLTRQGRQRQEAQDKIQESTKSHLDKLTGLELDYTAQVRTILEERDQQLRELQAKWAEDDEKQHQKDIDEKIQLNEAESQERLAELQLEYADKLMSEQAYNELVFQEKQAAKEREMALVKQKYGEESAEYKKLNAEKIKEQAAHNAKAKKEDDTMSKFKKGISKVEETLNSDNVKFLEESLGKQTVLYKAFQAARKLAAIAKIEMNLVEEISGYWEGASEMGPYGIIWAALQSGVAVARAGIAVSSLDGYAKGGATGDGMTVQQRPSGNSMLRMMGTAMGLNVGTSGKLVDNDGLEVAGIVHKNEYVIPAWMREDPEVLQVEDWLETRRQRGFYNGGTTTEGDTRAAGATGLVAGTAAPDAATNQLLVQVLTNLDQRLQGVEQWATDLTVSNDLLGLSRELDKVKKAQNNGNISSQKPSN